MKTEAQSLLWRVFAVAFVISIGVPQAIGEFSHFSILKTLENTVIFGACVGITTWSFGYRLGANIFWKVVAVLLMVVLGYALFQYFAGLMNGKPDYQSGSWFAAVATFIALFAFAFVALCRAGNGTKSTAADLIVEGRSSLGNGSRLDRVKTRATS
jgi:hypothetical protein